MLWLSLLCAVFAFVSVILALKLILIRREIKCICLQFSDRLKPGNDTNTLISVSPYDPCLCHLAQSINIQLKILRNERRRLMRGDTELKDAVANLSHDLRTPLTAVCGYLELLERAPKSDAAQRYIDIITERIGALCSLVEELFSYSVIVSPENYVSAERLSLNTVLEQSIAGMYAVLKKRGITPEISMPDTAVIRTLSRTALSRIFENVLGNAVKYSDGDLKITLKDSGEIIFSNSACTLNTVAVGRLFDRFFTLRDGKKSTGLGLSIAKILTEQCGGRIFAEYDKNILSIHIAF